MNLEKLYELAFEYKKTKLWKILWESELFAVKLSDGRIGYISIMGNLGEYCALGLYIGEEGLNSLRNLMNANESYLSPFEFQERVVNQSCLQCAFEGKDDLSKEQREEAKAYARAHGIRISGKNAYPNFVKCQPGCYPWHLTSEKDQGDLCQALAAAIKMAQLLEEKMPSELGLGRMEHDMQEIPMLELQDGGYVLKKTELPEAKQVSWPKPLSCNEIGIAALKKLKKSDTWECEIIQYTEPVQNNPDEPPYFPIVFMAVNADRDYILPVEPVGSYRENPEELLNYFIDALLREKLCPKKMKVRDERTYDFAEIFCSKLKIPISIEEELPVLEQVEDEFFRHFSMSEEEQVGELLDFLSGLMEDGELNLKDLPPELVGELEKILQLGALPEEVGEKVGQFLHPEGKKGGLQKSDFKMVKKKSNLSYVLSVSVYTGCYRHIQISGDSTLQELHNAIQDAFQFDDDHAYGFFMDNKRWSNRDCYYAPGAEDGYRSAGRYTLDQAGLYKGKKFLYLFDFGDEWTFQCKVLRVAEEDTPVPVILKSKGEAPKQYPDWDEDWEDE